jgi:hypothetical protein
MIHVDTILERLCTIHGLFFLFLWCWDSQEKSCSVDQSALAANQSRDLGKVAINLRISCSFTGFMPFQCLALDLKDLSISTPLLKPSSVSLSLWRHNFCL